MIYQIKHVSSYSIEKAKILLHFFKYLLRKQKEIKSKTQKNKGRKRSGKQS